MNLYTDRRDGRSYKKAVHKEEYNGARSKRKIKRAAAKAVRRYPHHIPDGSAYKQIMSNWFIYDWIYDMRFDDPEELLDHDIITYPYNGENYLSK